VIKPQYLGGLFRFLVSIPSLFCECPDGVFGNRCLDVNELIYLLKRTFIVYLLAVLGNSNTVFAEEYVEPQIDLNIELAREETRANIQYILGHVLKKSAALQEKYGDFAPYGVGLFKDGSIKSVWYAKPGETVNNPAQSIPLIRRALQAQAVSEKIVGSAVVYKYKKEATQALQLMLNWNIKLALPWLLHQK